MLLKNKKRLIIICGIIVAIVICFFTIGIVNALNNSNKEFFSKIPNDWSVIYLPINGDTLAINDVVDIYLSDDERFKAYEDKLIVSNIKIYDVPNNCFDFCELFNRNKTNL